MRAALGPCVFDTPDRQDGRVSSPRSMPPVRIVDDELELRPLQPSDATALARLADDSHVLHWLPLPSPYRLADATNFCTVVAPAQRDSGGGGVWAMMVYDELAGVVDLRKTDWRARTTEIGYWIGLPARGRGYTTRAVSALSRWALTAGGLRRIELRVAPANVASNRVARKAGFQLEGTLRSAGFTRRGQVDLCVYSLIDADLT